MIEPGDRVLLIGEGREFFVKAGQNVLSTDKGQLDLASLVGKTAGDILTTHNGSKFTVRIPRPTDFSGMANGQVRQCCPKILVL